MLKKLALFVLVTAFVAVFSISEANAQQRINFKRGRSSATVSGSIAAKGYREYALRGRAGQVMSVRITSTNGAVSVNAGTASGKDFSFDLGEGDTLLSIVNSGRATRYTLTVTIR